ncbi:MAG: TonB-dependent receptor, partial [Bacteroidales bacterium]|nr:TonB-dependent receptor [Bacteroidales bacterium]
YQYVGIYPGGTNVYHGRITDNVDANITAITHIPRARLIITVRLEAALLRNSQYTSDRAFRVSEASNQPLDGNIYEGNSYTAIYPSAYMDLDGNVHPWTEESAQNPELSRLVMRSVNIYTFAPDGYDPYFSANFSVTKEIGNHASVSFFANNFTNSRKYVTSRATGVSAIFTPNFYYGITCRLKF